MAKVALDIIKKAEDCARKTIYEAEVKAQKMISDANTQAEIDIKNTKDTCKAVVAREKAVATQKASVQTKQYRDETDKLCKNMEKQLLSKKKRAIFELTKFIIEQG